MTEQTHTVGIPMVRGYLTATIEADSEHDALNIIKQMAEEGVEIHGRFGMPGALSHKPSMMIVEPANVLGYLIVR
jgi:hypothetical protein